MNNVQIVLPKLHPAQQAVFDSPARFKVMVAGRRFGKSRLAATIALGALLRGRSVWWIAPTYDISRRVGWRMVSSALRPLLSAGYGEGNKTDLLIELAGGGRFQCKSADRPEKLVGEGLDLVVFDEAGIIQELAWLESVRPALADRRGQAVFIGTPKGHNWFWRAYNAGLDPLQPEWQSWSFPTSSNPFIATAEIEAARAGLPERIFQQEFLAQFIDDAGGVFRGVSEVCQALPAEPQPDGLYVFGVDWARDVDFSVISIFDVNARRQVWLERFNQVSWSVQRGRLEALAARYRPQTIVAESNSVGGVNIEALQQSGLPVRPFTTTSASKTAIIEALALAIERRELTLLSAATRDGALQQAELQAYALERLPSGVFRYSAPPGGHDDTVIATALAWHAVSSGRLAMPIFL